MRIIDAKLLEKQVKEAFEKTNPVLMGCLLRWIRYKPTIDAVPVTRCKDCKHCNSFVLPTGRLMYNCMECSHDHQVLLNPNDFCSRGERKGGDSDD